MHRLTSRIASGKLVRLSTLAVMLALMALSAGVAHAANITVCPSGCDHLTIQAAVNSASDGDTIVIAAGLYKEDVHINKSLALQGAGADSTIIEGTARQAVITIGAGATVSISGVTVQNGGRSGVNGSGGIFNDGIATLSDSKIINNFSFLGGGIANGGEMTIISSAIDTNIGVFGGGGIFNQGTLSIYDSSVSNNQAGNSGGGILNQNATVTIFGSTIDANSAASSGGGISTSGGMTLVNSTISGNLAGVMGGGIFSAGSVDMHNVTIFDNDAGSPDTGPGNGGGIVHEDGGLVAFENSIIAGNRSEGGAAPDCAGVFTSLGHNVIGNGNDAYCSAFDATDQLVDDPMLAPLAYNGGPTMTHALQPGSPATDAGNPASCTDQDGNPLNADQRGMARPADSDGDDIAICDSGAFESDVPPPPPIITLASSKDSAIKRLLPNLNDGANEALALHKLDHSHIVVAFDMTDIELDGLKSAMLVMTLKEGPEPPLSDEAKGLFALLAKYVKLEIEQEMMLDAHRLRVDWSEGNGDLSGSHLRDMELGSGPGVTWNCPTDVNIRNLRSDCYRQWRGAANAIASSTAPSALISQGASGEVSWDVTQDVLEGASFGWLIRNAGEWQFSEAAFYSKEGAEALGNPDLAPRLILEYEN
ncbi:MAG: hypothetical protein L0177_15730 [Chloroflexi bacterium]|nr:hypothetical protein [Chloroflexota bacterium]